MFKFFRLLLPVCCLSVFGQTPNLKILVPNSLNTLTNSTNTTYIPETGFNLYDSPKGKHIGRIKRDNKNSTYKNYLLNIFICPLNRAPELFPLESLAPLDNNTYAIPIVRQKNGYAMLFDTIGPYYYWVDIAELKKLGFSIENWTPTKQKLDVETEDMAGILPPDFDKLKDLKREFSCYLPENGVPLYNKPNGKKIAKLAKFCPVAKYSDGNFRMYILSDSNACLKHITTEHLYHLTDETYAIPYYKKENNYLLLFEHNNVKYWCNAKDFTDKDYKVLSWKNYFIENKGSLCYVNTSGASLKEGPYEDSKEILNLNDDTHEIQITGYDGGICEGSWCKVTITIYKENPCRTMISEKENILKKVEGWIKLIDKNGQPTIHINTKGC